MSENNGCTCKSKSVTLDDVGKKCRYTPQDTGGVISIEAYICGVRVLGAPYYVGGRNTSVARTEPEVKINGEWVPASLVTIERECKCAEKPKPRRPNVWESLDDINPNVGYVQGNDGFTYSYANGKWWTWNGVGWCHDPQHVSRATVFIAAPTPRVFRSLTDVPPHVVQVQNDKGVTWKRQYSAYGFNLWDYRMIEDVWTNDAVPGWFRRIPAEKLRGPYYAC